MQALQADHAVTGRSCTTFQFDSMKLFEQCSEPPYRGQYYLFFSRDDHNPLWEILLTNVTNQCKGTAEVFEHCSFDAFKSLV